MEETIPQFDPADTDSARSTQAIARTQEFETRLVVKITPKRMPKPERPTKNPKHTQYRLEYNPYLS